MRILILTHHRRFKANWRCFSIGRQLAARSHEVTMVCTADTARWRLRETQEHGVRVVEAPDLLWRSMRSGWDPYNTLRRMRWLRDNEFDLIHLFESRPGSIYPALRYLKRRRVPVVMDWIDWWGHGGLIKEHRPLWYQWMFGGVETWYEEHFRTLAQASTVIARGLGERAIGLGVAPESIFWVPNGCDPSIADGVRNRNWRDKFKIPPEAFVAGFSALDVTLGVDVVIQAVEMLVQKHPNLLLLLTGKQSKALERRIAASPAKNSIRHLGYVAAEDYPQALSCVDAFVVPFVDRVANRGRWPGRINDYLSLGIPLITNPVGEMKTLLCEHEIGLLCGETADGFAGAMATMIEQPQQRLAMGQAARRLAEGELNWSSLIDRIEQAYDYAAQRLAAQNTTASAPVETAAK